MRKSILFGALLAAICFSTTTIANTNDFSVKFIRFYAAQLGDHVQVHWVTASEVDNEFFTVERSNDMSQWETLKIISGAGTSPSGGTYTYYDLEPKSGKNFYRIKQTDLDGSFEFTNIEKVEVEFFAGEEIAEVAVAPNPLPGYSTSFVAKSKVSLEGAIVKIIDIMGKEIQVDIDANDTELTISPVQKTPGFYFLIIQKGQQSIVKKIKFE